MNVLLLLSSLKQALTSSDPVGRAIGLVVRLLNSVGNMDSSPSSMINSSRGLVVGLVVLLVVGLVVGLFFGLVD